MSFISICFNKNTHCFPFFGLPVVIFTFYVCTFAFNIGFWANNYSFLESYYSLFWFRFYSTKAAWRILGFWILLIIPTFYLMYLVCNIATVKHWMHETVIQYILIAAGNIAVIGKDKNGMNLKLSINNLLQIFNQRNHKWHCNILFVHVWRISNWKRH